MMWVIYKSNMAACEKVGRRSIDHQRAIMTDDGFESGRCRTIFSNDFRFLCPDRWLLPHHLSLFSASQKLSFAFIILVVTWRTLSRPSFCILISITLCRYYVCSFVRPIIIYKKKKKKKICNIERSDCNSQH